MQPASVHPAPNTNDLCNVSSVLAAQFAIPVFALFPVVPTVCHAIKPTPVSANRIFLTITKSNADSITNPGFGIPPRSILRTGRPQNRGKRFYRCLSCSCGRKPDLGIARADARLRLPTILFPMRPSALSGFLFDSDVKCDTGQITHHQGVALYGQ